MIFKKRLCDTLKKSSELERIIIYRKIIDRRNIKDIYNECAIPTRTETEFCSALLINGKVESMNFLVDLLDFQDEYDDAYSLIAKYFLEKPSDIELVIRILMLRIRDYQMPEMIIALEQSLIEYKRDEALVLYIELLFEVKRLCETKKKYGQNENLEPVITMHGLDNLIKYVSSTSNKKIATSLLREGMCEFFSFNDLEILFNVLLSRKEEDNFEDTVWFSEVFKSVVIDSLLEEFKNEKTKSKETKSSKLVNTLGRVLNTLILNTLIKSIVNTSNSTAAFLVLESLSDYLGSQDKIKLSEVIKSYGTDEERKYVEGLGNKLLFKPKK